MKNKKKETFATMKKKGATLNRFYRLNSLCLLKIISTLRCHTKEI